MLIILLAGWSVGGRGICSGGRGQKRPSEAAEKETKRNSISPPGRPSPVSAYVTLQSHVAFSVAMQLFTCRKCQGAFSHKCQRSAGGGERSLLFS